MPESNFHIMLHLPAETCGNASFGRITRLTAGLLGSTTMLLGLAAMPAVAQQAGESGNVGLADIVVTAQKRTENLRDVPASAMVLDSTAIVKQGVAGFSDYMTLVPGLAQNNTGGEGQGAMIVRGLNTGYSQTSNTSAVYLDDIALSATGALSFGGVLTPDPDTADIERLEALKGPQGTLYGAASLGGLLRIINNKPDTTEFSGKVRVTGMATEHGNEGYMVSGMANIPIVSDKLALRVSASSRQLPGYMKNVTLGSKDRAAAKKWSVRAALRWEPTENFDITASYQRERLRTVGWTNAYIDANFQPIIGDKFGYTGAIEPTTKSDFQLIGLTANLHLDGIGTLTSATSYLNMHNLQDHDDNPWRGVFNIGQGLPDDTYSYYALDIRLKKFTQEIRFATERLGNWEGTAGLFFTSEQGGVVYTSENRSPTSPIPADLQYLARIPAQPTYIEGAAFGNLTYHIGEVVDLTLGGRYSQDRTTAPQCQQGFGFFTPENPDIATVPDCAYAEGSGSAFTYLGSATWHITRDINIYARIATAYRPGGPQIQRVTGLPNSFGPDRVRNYEIGFKGEFLDRRLRTNLAAYYMEWTDVQLQQNTNNVIRTENAGEAHIKGIEAELQAAPFPGLVLGGSFAYTDAKLVEVSPGASAQMGAVSGDRLPYTPKFAVAATADYTYKLSDDASLIAGATYRHQGSRWSSFPGDPLNIGVLIPAYDTTDMRLGARFGRFDVMARVTNLFDKYAFGTIYQPQILPSAGPYPFQGTVIRPRTFSIEIGAEF